MYADYYLLFKLPCTNSTFANIYRHLSYKYELSEQDWHSDLAYLRSKVKMRYNKTKAHKYPLTLPIIIELCDIRDSRHMECDIVDRAQGSQLLEALCRKSYL